MQIGVYEIGDELAQGGGGVVYRAQDTRLGREVVLKLLKIDEPTARERFRREAKAMARLVHPSVVPLLDFGEHESSPYLVMPYMLGHSLQDVLDAKGPLPLEQAIGVMTQIARGLLAVHDQALVHRDLKPANLLLDAQGNAFLTDFGLVKSVGLNSSMTVSLSVRGRFLGTPGYWPEEQARGRHLEIGPESDVYGFGATLYALLSGDAPGGAKTLQEALTSYETPPPRLSERRPEVPAWLEDLVHRCLERAPQERPSMSQVLHLLETRTQLAPPADVRPNRAPRAQVQPNHLRLLLGGVLIGIALLSGVVVMSLLEELSPQTHAELPRASPSSPTAAPTAADPELGSLPTPDSPEPPQPDPSTSPPAHDVPLGLASPAELRAAWSTHRGAVLEELAKRYPDPSLRRLVLLVHVPEAGELAEVALLVSKCTHQPELNVREELATLDRMAAELRPQLSGRTLNERARNLAGYVYRYLSVIDRATSMDPASCSLATTLQRRGAIQMTTGLVLIALGRRLNLPIVATNVPNHFCARLQGDPPVFLDVYAGGAFSLRELEQVARVAIKPADIAPATRGEVAARLLNNLSARFKRRGELREAERAEALRFSLVGY